MAPVASPHSTSVLQAAAELAAPIARRIVARAAEALLRSAAAAEPAERRLLVDAGRLLTQRRQCFCSAYAVCLRREFEAPGQRGPMRETPLTLGEVALMTEEDVDETVEMARAQQLVFAAVDAELARLEALMRGAKGLAVAGAAANPLRPQVWVRAARAAALQCEVPPAALGRWLPRLSEALGPELASVYRQLSDALRRQGVAAAAVALPPAPGSSPAPAASRAASLLDLRDLRRLVAGSAEPAAPSASTPPDAAAVPPAAEPVPAVASGLPVRGPPPELQDRRAARAAAAGAGLTPLPAVAEEVVRVMVDAMAADPRLLPPVQHAVRELEPALLRLVRHDPRFFLDPHHPARRLLAEITERSLAWPAADMAGCAAFLEPLRRTAAALAPLRGDSAEPLAGALRRLEQAWADQEERSRRDRANAARALGKAERRNLLARRIAERLRQRPDVARAPERIQRFLAGPWAQVMAAAQMADPSGAPDPGGYGAVVDDLLCTTRSDPAPPDPARPASLVPALLAALRGGLASIEYPEDRTREFLRALAGPHRLGPQPPGEPPGDPAHPGEPGPGEPDEHLFWLEPTEVRESALMDTVPPAVRAALSQHAAAEAGRAAAAAPPPLPAALERLHAGAWVDLLLAGHWSRWRLAWASPQSLLFMFADGAGCHRSMTRPVLGTLLATGALRFVCEQTILDSALDAVAGAALRNSLRRVR